MCERYKDLVQAIAMSLGFEWTYSGSQGRLSKIEGPNGAAVCIASIWNEPKRIEVYGSYPRDHHPNAEEAPKITCSVKRGALAIAKDIRRRFLPDYLPLYEERLASYHNTLEQHARAEGVLESLRATLGDYASPWEERDLEPLMRHKYKVHTPWLQGPRLEAELYATRNSRVDIEIRDLTPGQARRVCALIREELDN